MFLGDEAGHTAPAPTQLGLRHTGPRKYETFMKSALCSRVTKAEAPSTKLYDLHYISK